MSERVDKSLRNQTLFLPTDFAFVDWVHLSGDVTCKCAYVHAVYLSHGVFCIEADKDG